MNDRIKKLLNKCTTKSMDGPMYNPFVDQEKFAKLILEECVKEIHKEIVIDACDDIDKGWNMGLNYSLTQIKNIL